jgi:virginiamycin B lyase
MRWKVFWSAPKKSGSTVTLTVVSDQDGRYSFPAARLEPGQYSLRIRAVGYDLDNSKPVSVAADKTATADLALRKTEDVAAQLSNAEWLASTPGTDAQKGQLLKLRRLSHAGASAALYPRRR